MSDIRRIVSDAEVMWGNYSTRMCHEIQEEIETDGIYDSHNFYEFCKGYVFASLKLQAELAKKDEQLLKLAKLSSGIIKNKSYQLVEIDKVKDLADEYLKEMGD